MQIEFSFNFGNTPASTTFVERRKEVPFLIV
jgi:hypothetical protein